MSMTSMTPRLATPSPTPAPSARLRGRVPEVAALALAVVPGAGLALATGSVAWTLVGAGLGVGLGLGLLAWAAHARAAGQEKLLRTVVEGVPLAIVLYGDSGRIAFTNAAARELFFEGRAVEGQNFLSMLQAAPAPLRQALLARSDELFTVEVEGESETFHLSKRDFGWSGEPHTLLLVKHLTQELARQEVDIWKKVIRVMSHELNNSLAPLSSLLHSARLITHHPEQLGKLARVLDLLEERATHLRTFLEGYVRFARLPGPRPAWVDWSRLLAGLQALYPQATFASPPRQPGWFDPTQVEQVLINLLKNAQEAGGSPEAVSLEVEEAEGGFRLRVHDRGRGLTPEVLQHALLPFYTTKEKGSGLGLALCREIIDAHHGRLRLENREGGGATITVWLPGREAGNAGQSSRARLTMTRS
jgi:two-component system nitrogen regulation sensor histidine kinase NtrY